MEKQNLAGEMEKTYNPQAIEDRLYTHWEESGYFAAQCHADKKPFTIVMPPPNITGQLHMGH
ncbi:MAG: class I tRNA ligase family protein, partial [Clostridia bacterium]